MGYQGKGVPCTRQTKGSPGMAAVQQTEAAVQRGQESRREKGEERKPRRMVSYKTVRAPVSGARLVLRSVVESA